MTYNQLKCDQFTPYCGDKLICPDRVAQKKSEKRFVEFRPAESAEIEFLQGYSWQAHFIALIR
jgi:hypothetical protein